MIHKVEQNTDEWLRLRMGKFTASSFKDLFSKPNTITYEKAIYRPVFERMTGETPESFSNEWMQRGHDMEETARLQYEFATGNDVQQIGFVELNEWVGCSPDGFIGDDGLLEIKCPAYNTHINYLLGGKLPSTYKWQVHGQLWVTEREWCDFVSYYPKLKPLIVRVKRDEKLIKQLEETVTAAIEKAKEVLTALT